MSPDTREHGVLDNQASRDTGSTVYSTPPHNACVDDGSSGLQATVYNVAGVQRRNSVIYQNVACQDLKSIVSIESQRPIPAMLDQNGSSSNGGDVEINAHDFAQRPNRACTKSERLHRVRDESACIGIFDIISPALPRADGSLVGASGTADDIPGEDAQINAIGKVHMEGRSQENEVSMSEWDAYSDTHDGSFNFASESDSDDGLVTMMFTSLTSSALRVPLEIWEYIIDFLKDDPAALAATELVCKAWRPRSRFRLSRVDIEIVNGFHKLSGIDMVYRLARLSQAAPQRRRRLEIVRFESSTAAEGQVGSIAHLRAFAATFAGLNLPRLKWLYIGHGEWTPGAFPQDVFLHLSTFTNITLLELDHVILPSMSVFGHLVCALVHLEKLEISSLSLATRRAPPAGRRWIPPSRLAHLEVKGNVSFEVFYALVAAKLTMPYRRLRFHSVPAEAIEGLCVWRLLQASKSTLEFLDIDLSYLLSLEAQIARKIIERKLRLPQIVTLKELSLHPRLKLELIEQSSTHSVFIHAVSQASSVALQTVRINITFDDPSTSSADGYQILAKLCQGLSPLDNLLTPIKYPALEELELGIGLVEGQIMTVTTHWPSLASTWFPNLHARGVVKHNYL